MIHRKLLLAAILTLPVAIAGRHEVGRYKAGHYSSPQQSCAARSSDWLASLPAGETKRAFILDCTGCHQLDSTRGLKDGALRTEAQWADDVARMLSYAGATTGFPVIAHDRDPAQTGAWLARHLRRPAARTTCPQLPAGATVTEFLLPEAGDLAHDVAVDPSGTVIVTGMFTHQMLTLDPASGVFTEVPITVNRANPRAVDLDSAGNWWAVFGSPRRIGRYAPVSREWQSWDVGMYAHSLAIDARGRVWFNGHFTKAPEQIGYVDPRAGVTTVDVPPHPTLAQAPGGPIPYELRVAPNGHVWMSELQGNRLVGYDPERRAFRTHDMPVTRSGPRRFDIDPAGMLWVPAYADNALLRFDPATGAFTTFALPVADAVPYVVRVDPATGLVWIGTGAADALFSFDPRTRAFVTYPLPSAGGTVRHLAIDSRRGEIWAAYGASPGIPSRIARLRPGARR